MTGHALASPSGAEKWIACANSLAAEIGQPDESSGAADLGTDKHELLHDCLQFDVPADTFLVRRMKCGNDVTQAFAADVQKVVNNVRQRIADHELAGGRVEMDLEVQVPTDQITGEEGATGTSDVVLRVYYPDRNHVDVIDAKFGYQEVEVISNPQLMIYGHGVLTLHEVVDEFDTVTLVIEQPARSDYSQEWTTTADAIRQWAEEVATPAAEKALMIHRMVDQRALKMEDFNVTEKGCMWCKAAAVCPARIEHVAEAIECDFGSIDLGLEGTVDFVSIERLGEIFPDLEIIEDWIKAVRARVELEIMAGRSVPGLKAVLGKKGNRTWVSDDEAEAMMKKFRLKLEQMYSFKLLGPKPILEALKEQPRRLKQIESLVVQPQGKPHIVLDTDPRPALEIKPLDDGFEAVDENDFC